MFFLDTPEPGIARLTIDAPARRNAIPVAEWDRLATSVTALPREARVLLIGGTADFSAGADLGEFDGFRQEPAAAARFRQAMRVGIDALAAVPIPVIAVIAGGCYGAGVALALAADIRVAGERARFAVTPSRLGIGYPAQDIARLAGLVGRGQAARMLYAAEVIEAHRASVIGLVETVAAEPWTEATILAREIADKSNLSTRMLKSVLSNGNGDPDASFDALFAGPDLAEGLAAHRERRAARFA